MICEKSTSKIITRPRELTSSLENNNCQRQGPSSIPDSRLDSTCVSSTDAETCNSPEHNHVKMLSDNELPSAVISRFKHCNGKPACYASNKDQARCGAQGRSACVDLKKITNWN